MAEGYFNDGTINVELGAHVFALPAPRRRIVQLAPHDQPASLLDSGGGVMEIDLTAQALRANLGDAERFIYELFEALATSDPGELAFEDNRGYRHVYGNAVCEDAVGEVHAYSFVDMRLHFLAGEKSSEPAWAGSPGPPGAYPFTGTVQDYAAAGVSLGLGGALRIEMDRSVELREIPRARGARATVPPRRAAMKFVVTADRVAGADTLATDLEDLARSISGYVNLTGNGNTFTDVLLERMRPGHTDRRFTTVQYTFAKDLSRGGAGAWSGTTTTAAPTTTTTTTA